MALTRPRDSSIDRLPPLRELIEDVAEIGVDLERQGVLLVADDPLGGEAEDRNGGSAADAEHIVGELMKGYLLRRPVPEEIRAKLIATSSQDGNYLADHLQGGLPGISLVSQTALISAIANDTAADMAYAQQVYAYGREGDAIIGISTSGNARNVIHAVQVARALGLQSIGLTGPSGGALKPLCEVCICVPAENTPAVQERHLPIFHVLCAMLEEEFFA